MSLINQALKKAQRDRSPTSLTSGDGISGNQTPPPPAGGMMGHSAPQPGGFNLGLIIGLAVAFAVLIGLVAGLVVVLIKKETTSEQTAVTQAAPTLSPVQNSALPAPEPSAPTIQPQSTRTDFIGLQKNSQPSPLEELRTAREAAEAKALAEAEAASQAEEEAKIKAAIQPKPEIIEWLSTARINGVKLAGADSKVILNGKAFGIGETVNYNLKVKVLVVQEKRILFVDDNGTKYMKVI